MQSPSLGYRTQVILLRGSPLRNCNNGVVPQAGKLKSSLCSRKLEIPTFVGLCSS
jgi:hypothetical protein